MPPSKNSRYFQSRGKRDENGVVFLSERTPINADDVLDGTHTVHIVVEGETLPKLARRYYAELNEAKDLRDYRGPEHLWWILADVNGIMDLTLDIPPGKVLYIPSPRVVREKVLNR